MIRRVVYCQGGGFQATLSDNSRSKRAYLVQASCILFFRCLKVSFESLYTFYGLTTALKIKLSSNSPFFADPPYCNPRQDDTSGGPHNASLEFQVEYWYCCSDRGAFGWFELYTTGYHPGARQSVILPHCIGICVIHCLTGCIVYLPSRTNSELLQKKTVV